MHHSSIDVQSLNYTYPDGTDALHNVSFTLEAAQRVALIGANGSGKSTLLLHLNGIHLPQSGSIRVGAWPMLKKHLGDIRNFVGIVFQNPDDQLFMPTVGEDIAFGPRNLGLEESVIVARAEYAMQSVGLDLEHYWPRYAMNLSGGEKKRVAISGVLAMHPGVLVLDEPTAQLDPRSRRQLIQVLAQLPQTQLIATHDLDMVMDLCDRTLVLSQGKLVYDGPTCEVLSDETFLQEHGLEPPLSYRRPYCLREDGEYEKVRSQIEANYQR